MIPKIKRQCDQHPHPQPPFNGQTRCRLMRHILINQSCSECRRTMKFGTDVNTPKYSLI